MEQLQPILDQIQLTLHQYTAQAAPVVEEAKGKFLELIAPALPYYNQFASVIHTNAALARPYYEQFLVQFSFVATAIAFVQSQLPTFHGYPVNYVGISVILLHVLFYNLIAQLEHHTKLLTRIFGKLAIYINILLIIASGLIRNHYLMKAIEKDAGSRVFLDPSSANILSYWLVAFGIYLNLWVLSVLGLKNMYNGDSFGYHLKAPITTGPFAWFDDPQYFGTTCLLLGHAIRYQSRIGYGLTGVMYLAYSFSVMFIEGPHMKRIYANLEKKKVKKEKESVKPKKTN